MIDLLRFVGYTCIVVYFIMMIYLLIIEFISDMPKKTIMNKEKRKR